MDIAIIVMLAVMTLCAAAEAWKNYMILSRICRNTYSSVIICPISADTQNVEELLRDTYSALSGSLCSRALIVDMGADEETVEICRRFINDYGFFSFTQQDRAKEFVNAYLLSDNMY
ncbi:MAG: hypothetical protein LIO69_00895 [Oscillospiraceae bacterium]|nr:hypothetical protein [Oscillospiraceae bacterium]